jgi:hypothetical protein
VKDGQKVPAVVEIIADIARDMSVALVFAGEDVDRPDIMSERGEGAANPTACLAPD